MNNTVKALFSVLLLLLVFSAVSFGYSQVIRWAFGTNNTLCQLIGFTLLYFVPTVVILISFRAAFLVIRDEYERRSNSKKPSR